MPLSGYPIVSNDRIHATGFGGWLDLVVNKKQAVIVRQWHPILKSNIGSYMNQ